MIDDLPDVCLEHIFSFLQIPDRLTIEKVCKRWYGISKRGWKNITSVNIYGKYDLNTTHLILQRCGRYIKKLNLSIVEEPLKWIPMVIKLCKLDQIEEIDLYLPADPDPDTRNISELIVDALKNLFSMVKNVVNVKIEFNPEFNCFDYLNVMPPEKLRSLRITCEYDKFRNDKFSIDVLRFPNLEVLDCQGMTFLELQERSYDGAVFKHKKIDLGYCTIGESLREKLKFFTELEELTLCRTECNMNNEDIRAIAANCPKLKVLGLGDLPNVCSLCFEDIGRMSSLERLDLGNFHIRNTLDIKHLTNVKELKLYHCEWLTSHDGLVQCILHSPNLQFLMLDRVIPLKDTFLKDVLKIYNSGRRTVPLRIDVEIIVYSIYYGRARKWEIPKHPLLEVFMSYNDDF